MSFETFTAPSIDNAKKAMRKELGSSAVILGTKRLPDGQFEIRAIRKGVPLNAQEAQGEKQRNDASFDDHQQEKSTKRASSLAAKAAKGAQHNPAPRSRYVRRNAGLMALRNRNKDNGGTNMAANIERKASDQAISNLQGDFSSKLVNTAPGNDPIYNEFKEKLGRHGISDALVRALSVEAQDAPHAYDPNRLEFAFSRVMKSTPLKMNSNAPIMLVGQTGAGKTSSAAKIAVRAAQIGKKVAFISADVGRAGAMEQMHTYAEALDTKFWAVEDPHEVQEIIQNEHPEDIVVLDTPGVSPFAPADVAAIKSFRDSLRAEPLLVMPASGDVEEHVDWAMAFYEIGVRRCIITKFDTSRRVGAALTAAFEANLALAAFSEAPFISEGMVDANPQYLAHRLLMSEPARIAASLQS